MSLHRKLNVKIFLMFIVAENTGSVNISQYSDSCILQRCNCATIRQKETSFPPIKTVFERKEFTPFPSLTNKRKPKSPIKRMQPVNLYCTCKLPDTHTLYFICDGCEKEFHPVCLRLDEAEAQKGRKIYCRDCQTTKSKKQKWNLHSLFIYLFIYVFSWIYQNTEQTCSTIP